MPSTLRHPESSAAHLVRYSLALGHVISVDDGGAWAVKKSSDEAVILDAIDSVDESQVIIRDANGEKLAWAFIVLGNAPDEDINDCSANAYMHAVDADYRAKFPHLFPA